MCGAADTVAVCPCYQPRQDVFWMRTGRTAQKDYFVMQQRVLFSGKISTFTMNCSDLKCFFCLTTRAYSVRSSVQGHTTTV